MSDLSNLTPQDTLKAKPQEHEGLLTEFLHSAVYAAVQEPVKGVSQLVDHVARTNMEQKVTFMSKPESGSGKGDWLAQQLGGAAGMLLPFMLVKGGLNGVMGESIKGTQGVATLGMSLKEAGLTGFAYDCLLKPTDASATNNFWVARGLSGVSGAATFMTLTGSAYGLGKLSMAAESRGIIGTSTLVPLLRNPISAGILSGVPAGLVSAEGSSLANNSRLASAQEIGQSIAGMALVGGVFGAKEVVKAKYTDGQSIPRFLAGKINKAWTTSPDAGRLLAGGDVIGPDGAKFSVEPGAKGALSGALAVNSQGMAGKASRPGEGKGSGLDGKASGGLDGKASGGLDGKAARGAERQEAQQAESAKADHGSVGKSVAANLEMRAAVELALQSPKNHTISLDGIECLNDSFIMFDHSRHVEIRTWKPIEETATDLLGDPDFLKNIKVNGVADHNLQEIVEEQVFQARANRLAEIRYRRDDVNQKLFQAANHERTGGSFEPVFPPIRSLRDVDLTALTGRGLEQYIGSLRMKASDFKAGKIILDVGAGIKQNLAKDAREMGLGATVVSIDPNLAIKTDISTAHPWNKVVREQARLNPEPNTIAAMGDQLPIASDSVDTVCGLFSVPYYFGDDEFRIQDAIVEYLRVLKPGGIAKMYPVPEAYKPAYEMAIKDLGISHEFIADPPIYKDGSPIPPDHFLLIQKPLHP